MQIIKGWMYLLLHPYVLPADSTLVTMIWMVILTSQMFAHSTIIIGKLRTTIAAKLIKLNKRNKIEI